MTDARPGTDAVAGFTAHLRKLADQENRGALAALRRSFHDANGMAAAACPHVVPFLGAREDLARDRAFFLVGALFALHSDAGGGGVSLGTAFRRINTAQEPRGGDNESTRRRFVALLDADAQDLGDHLRHAVSLARAHSVPLDWERVLRDVLAWRHPDRYVQRRLARDFWTVPAAAYASPEGEEAR